MGLSRETIVRSGNYRVGIIGAGNISSNYDEPGKQSILTHAHAVSELQDFTLVGFYDIDKDNSHKAALKWDCESFDNLELLLSNVDIAVIAVPDKYHSTYLEKSISYSGLKAIVMEKPLAISVDEGSQLLQIEELHNNNVFVNYSRRYSEAFVELKNWIINDSGRLILGCGYYGKGVLHNGSHFINLLGFFFGSLSVCDIGEVVNDYWENDPSVRVSFNVSGGKRPQIFLYPIPSSVVTIFDLELFFENGKIVYSGEKETISYYSVLESGTYKGEKNYVLIRNVNIGESSAMLGLWRNIYDVLLGKDTVRCDMEDAYSTLKICEEIKNSISGS